MPRDERRLAELFRSAESKLRQPATAERIMRLVRLDSLCTSLSDEVLATLIRVCTDGDEQSLREVLAVTPDAWLRNTLLQCLLSEEGRAEILDSIDLQRYNLDRADGGKGWTQ